MRVEVEDRINKFVSRGYRGLGVGIARSGDVPVKECEWQMVGLLPLFDLPRHDTADTVKKAIALGIAVKMVTGDQKAIAVETRHGLAQMIYDTDGFALVFPEHKFEIVKHLQSLDKVVGMTGDGVNDAPALAQVDIGIAVDDATDAARAATDIVLVPPDLSVIITTIRMSREIFLRMKNYAIYSIAMTVRIVFTFGILTLAWNWITWWRRRTWTRGSCARCSSRRSRSAWLSLLTIVLLAIITNSSCFESTGVETLCVSCMKNYHDFFQDQYQTCVMANNATGCGEMTGSVPQAASVSDVGTFRESVIDAYWTQYQEKYDSSTKLFEDLAAPQLAAERREAVGRGWVQPLGKGVALIGNGEVSTTNERKGSVRRSLVHLQVSISSQALLFVTRTASSNNWFFAEKLRNLLLVAFVLAQIVTSVIGWIDFDGYSTVLL
ncbi:Plasma membrane ATPase 2 [Phytophthora ramorum]|uniref:Plasma membrane ATPase 2 n=1 Tax=Phytophthora ramorum TaxID=164328 RepID=UPI0030B597AC|nr:Plasma membrane ATPase 2 [Phytophthora ramorum]